MKSDHIQFTNNCKFLVRMTRFGRYFAQFPCAGAQYSKRLVFIVSLWYINGAKHSPWRPKRQMFLSKISLWHRLLWSQFWSRSLCPLETSPALTQSLYIDLWFGTTPVSIWGLYLLSSRGPRSPKWRYIWWFLMKIWSFCKLSGIILGSTLDT